MVGAKIDQGKTNNNNSPHPTPPHPTPAPKEKTWAHHKCMLHEIFFFKIVGHHFLLELMVVTLVIEQIKENVEHNWYGLFHLEPSLTGSKR
jgi:hypothetical protein